MQRYSYSIAIRVWHPSIKPDEITQALGIKPMYSHQAGQLRKTPKGTLLEGVYRESYWHADPFNRGEYCSTDDVVEDALDEVLLILEPHNTFIQTLRNEGARVLVQIDSFSNRNYAFEFPPETLGRFSSLGVGLAHDVYPNAQSC
jgi:hypothetical protein